jgi:LPS export ABC transporter protein LptC
MKQPKSGQDNLSLVSTLLCIALFVMLSGSCENDIQKINSITSFVNLPDASGKNFESIYSDSSMVKVRLVGKEIRQFNNSKRPYIEFPAGLTAYLYDDSLNIESIIKANYVVYYKEESLWEAKNDVEAKNFTTGEQLNTEHLFWDEKKKLIYSNTYSRIVNKDGTFYGQEGFEANQDLTWWRLKGTKGTVSIRDEQ